jgi:curved DNA-binding protein CbpA
MRTLYDLLDVRSDADDEALSKAYRKAAKAHHPDLNAGDPDAPRRFRQIAAAIEVLRDAGHRAAYDRLLDWERQQHQHQHRLKRTRTIMAGAIAAAVLILVLVGGYALIRTTFSTSTTASTGENGAAPGPVALAAEQRTEQTELTRRAEREPTPGREQEERGQPAEFERQTAEHEDAAAREHDERRQAAERERQTAARETNAGRQQEERPRAAGRERQKTEREAPLRREQDERRQEHRAKHLAAIAEAAKSTAPTPSEPVQGTEIASSAASPRSFGPAEIAAARAFTRF